MPPFNLRRSPLRCATILVMAGAGLLARAETGVPQAAAKIDFNRDIRPILSENCFACHGADARAREENLRLDVRADAIKAGALAPGDLAKSEMWERILATDPKEVMPPPKTKKTLSAAQKDLIKRWIESGGEYADHWAFIPPAYSAIPAASGSSRPIDNFIMARLSAAGLAPAPPASKESWLRRVTFDLTGLGPTLEEIDAFCADDTPVAKRRVVDRLLGSRSFGEHFAVDWLDVARYADTFGRHEDADCVTWPYRSWVIDALNRNLPYDQFVMEQTAGDLMPNPTEDKFIATSFNRLAQQSNEAGSNPEEFRMEQVADRVKTNGIAFLGLSIECARCHDHKYDPISTKDFYSLAAFFNNIDELGLFGVYVGASPPPTMPIYTKAQEAQRADILGRIASLEQSILAEQSAARSRFAGWLKQNEPPIIKKPGLLDGITGWFFTPLPRAAPRKPLAKYDFESIKNKVLINSAKTSQNATLRNKAELRPGREGKCLKLEGDNSALLGGIAEVHRTDAFTIAMWLQPLESFKRAVVVHRSRAGVDAGCRGVEVILEEDRPSFALVHFNPGHEIRVRTKKPLPVNAWTHLAFTYDGSSKAAGMKIYWNGELVELETVRDQLYRDVVYRTDWGDDNAKDDGKELGFKIGGRTNDATFKNGLIDEFLFYDARLSHEEVRQLALLEDKSKSEDWFDWYSREQDEPMKKLAAALKAARDEENVLSGKSTDIMVMKEWTGPRRLTHVQKRGQYNQPGEEVQPEVPGHLLPLPVGAPRNRLGLAQWLVDKKNPLTARVAVNRLWQHFFGRGLAATTEDFGTQGQPPSHPELLDYLATTFMKNEWDVKFLIRAITLSNTYGQATGSPPASDPHNILLSCATRLRLNAEQVRDHSLAASGLLVQKLGGPSVKPYQPAGLWEEAGTQHTYSQDVGASLYRRSLYTFWRRTLPPPSMTLFDAPTREYCKPRRERTVTPLQSLVLMNDPQFVEAARVMAQQLVRRHPTEPVARATDAWRLLVTTPPSPDQLAVLTTYYQEELAQQSANPAGCELLVSKNGSYPLDKSLPKDQLAATTLLVRLVISFADTMLK